MLEKKIGIFCKHNKFKRFEELKMSFMFIKKSNGPKIDPCVTPQLIILSFKKTV